MDVYCLTPPLENSQFFLCYIFQNVKQQSIQLFVCLVNSFTNIKYTNMHLFFLQCFFSCPSLQSINTFLKFQFTHYFYLFIKLLFSRYYIFFIEFLTSPYKHISIQSKRSSSLSYHFYNYDSIV